MANEKGFIAELSPGSVDEKAINPGSFPIEAFEFTEASSATPTLTLKSAWKGVIAGNLDVTGNTAITGNITVTGNITSVVDITSTGDINTTNVDGSPLYRWYKIADPGLHWIATKTSVWTAADRFTVATGGWEVDFSSAVTAGTKAVLVYMIFDVVEDWVYARRAGDENISNTPNASDEISCAIQRVAAGTGTSVLLWLSDDYRVEFAVLDTSQDLWVSYPSAEYR